MLANTYAMTASTNGSSSSKIFHVDAYCYLCKKEFCNKYFLRTHLANKHKVFLNGNDLTTLSGASMSKLQNDLLNEQLMNNRSSGSSSGGGKNKKNSSSTSSNNNMNTSGGANVMHRSSSASSTSSNNSSASSSASISPIPAHNSQLHHHSSNPNTIANVLYSQQQQQKPSSPSSIQQQKLYNKLNGGGSIDNELLLNAYQKLNQELHLNGASNGTNGGVIEDFCELCNKQFCNKYYLKVI